MHTVGVHDEISTCTHGELIEYAQERGVAITEIVHVRGTTESTELVTASGTEVDVTRCTITW